jgi:enoyl-[acyl-carrier protein] reductase II
MDHNSNRLCEAFGISYPIIQGGMIWCSGWRLASAVSNAGGLGLIGSGSMNPELLRQHIQQCRASTPKPFGVNIPLMFSHAESFTEIVIEEKVPVVVTSAGSPSRFTEKLHHHGIKVAHVVSNRKFAVKAAEAGVDAVIAEGYEAGGHNGYEENTSMTLIPIVREAVSIPLIAAGGIGSGAGMAAAFALGAEGVQIGTRFIASTESSAHPAFKKRIVDATEGDTMVLMKRLVPVRLLRNKFFMDVIQAEQQGADREQLTALLGHGRAARGMFEGDLEEGELEAGQISGLIHEVKPVEQIVKELLEEFNACTQRLANCRF